jgi:hypothetical protein
MSQPAGDALPGAAEAATFCAERSATVPLAWGQRAMWDAFGDTAPGDGYFNFARIVAVPRGAGRLDPATVAQALGRLTARHDSLRITVRAGDDGEPCQTIHGSGQVRVTVVESAAESADASAARLADELSAPVFDYAREWPLRAGVITCSGAATRVVLVFCHLAADGHAADLVVRDLRLLLLRGAISGPPPPQLRGLVAEQQAGGQRRSAAALAHWERELRRTQSAMFADQADSPQWPRYWQAVLSSAAMDGAVMLAARRHTVSTATVLTAAAAAMVGAMTGRRACALTPIVSNRFNPRHSEVVTSLAQLGLLVVEPGGHGFGDLIGVVKPAALRAHRNAYYDQREMNSVITRLSQDCGTGVFPYCCFNDQRLTSDAARSAAGRDELDEAAIRAALPATTITWPASHEHLNCRFCLHVTGKPGELRISLTADTRFVSRHDIEAFLQGLERLVVEAAFRDARQAVRAGPCAPDKQ